MSQVPLANNVAGKPRTKKKIDLKKVNWTVVGVQDFNEYLWVDLANGLCRNKKYTIKSVPEHVFQALALLACRYEGPGLLNFLADVCVERDVKSGVDSEVAKTMYNHPDYAERMSKRASMLRSALLNLMVKVNVTKSCRKEYMAARKLLGDVK